MIKKVTKIDISAVFINVANTNVANISKTPKWLI